MTCRWMSVAEHVLERVVDVALNRAQQAGSRMFVRVLLDGAPWLCDVGVGAQSPTAPVEARCGARPSDPPLAPQMCAWAASPQRAPRECGRIPASF